jgi:hypothetical protein
MLAALNAAPASAAEALTGGVATACRIGRVEVFVGGKANRPCEAPVGSTSFSAPVRTDSKPVDVRSVEAESDRRRILMEELAHEQLRVAQLEQEAARGGSNAAALVRVREDVAALKREIEMTDRRR